MIRRRTHLALLFVLPLASCGTNWTVIKATTPNPFFGQTSFRLLPLEYVDLKVDGKSDAEHTSGMDAATAASWKEDKVAIKDHFRAKLTEDAADESIALGDAGTYTIKPLVGEIETGYYRIPAWNAVSRIHLRLQITDAGGGVLDEILLVPAVPFDIFNPATGGRLRTAANRMGAWAADYVVERVTSK